MRDKDAFTGNDRFEVLSHVGTGGMGVVYEALDRERNVRVAIKTLRIHGARQLLRFKQEFRALRDIQHTNLVKLGELFEKDGKWFFTMELVHGVDIREYVRGGDGSRAAAGTGTNSAEPLMPTDAATLSQEDSLAPLLPLARGEPSPASIDASSGDASSGDASSGDATEIDGTEIDRMNDTVIDPTPGGRRPWGFEESRLRQALRGLGAGLAALHRAGKVHCDIKPSNVLVTPEGRTVVLDFGVVTELWDATYSQPKKTIVGSPTYMAPEQAAGGEVGPLADWYAVGVLLFEALTGEVPFRAGTPAELVAIKMRTEAPHPSELVPDLPEDLASLCKHLLAINPDDRPTEAEILLALGIEQRRTLATGSDLHTGRTPLFVGRKRELEALRSAYDASRAGATVCVFIEGESGVGKSATAEYFIGQLGNEPELLVFRGQCHEREFVPYNAFDGVIDDLGNYLRAAYYKTELPCVPGGVTELLDVFPVLRSVKGLAAHTSDDYKIGDPRTRAFTALRELFQWIAGSRALVVVIHDIQWADADSLTLLTELVNRRGELPALFVATARQGDDGSTCKAAEIVRGDVRHIELGGLSEDEAEKLVHRLFERYGGGYVGDIETVVAETQGHPLFMAELVRYIAQQAQLEGVISVHRADLDDALRSRVAVLDEPAQALLETIVVAGSPLPRAVIAQAANMAMEEFAAQLAVLRDASLIRTSGAGRKGTVAPYHDRIREAVADDIAPKRREVVHHNLAHALEDHDGQSLRLAVHYFHAGELEESAHHAIMAARQSAEVFAFDQAAEFYSMAIIAGKHGADQQRQLLGEMGMALQNAGRPREAAEAYMAAAEWAPPADRLELQRRSAEQLLTGGHLDEGIEVLSTVLRQVNMHLPASARKAYAGLTWNVTRLRLRGAKWKSRPADRIPASILSTTDVCWTVAAGLSLVDTMRAMYFGSRGTLLALQAGEPFRIARSACVSSITYSALGKQKRALAMLEASQRAAAEHGSPMAQTYAELARYSYMFFCQQAWRNCVGAYRDIERLWHSAGKGRGYEIDFAVQFGTWALSMLGDPRTLSHRVDELVRDAQRVGNRLLEVSLRVYHVLVHLTVDDPDTGAADVAEAIASWLPGRDVIHLPHAWLVISQGEIALYRDQPFLGPQYEANFERLRKSPLWVPLWTRSRGMYVRGRLAVARAQSAMRRGPAGEAAGHLELAAAMARGLEKQRTPVQPLFAALLRAGIANVKGDSESAAKHLTFAADGLATLETMLYAIVARYRLGQTLGGSKGEALLAEARSWMHAHGIVRPDRIAATYSPGW